MKLNASNGLEINWAMYEQDQNEKCAFDSLHF